MMLAVAALFLLSEGEAANPATAQWALRRAETARFQLAVTLCGDVGRAADYRRLQAEQQSLEKRFKTAFGRDAIDWLTVDDRGDCDRPDAFRRTVIGYRQALADARDALGGE